MVDEPSILPIVIKRRQVGIFSGKGEAMSVKTQGIVNVEAIH